MAVINDIKSLFVANGIATGDIYLSTKAKLPDGPGPFTSLIATGGLFPLRTQNRPRTAAYVRPGVQIIVHCETPSIAMTLALQLYGIIVAVKNQMVNGVWYQDIKPQQEPFDSGTDDIGSGRNKVIFNVIPTKRP
jgi:hypothetical protein